MFELKPIIINKNQSYSERKDCLFETSSRIFWTLYNRYKPDAVLAMVSGGNDSRAMYAVAKKLNLPITHICHIVTGTGIPETTQYVRKTYADFEYLEPNAGNAYEKYVLRKGFFGKGVRAHMYAYHVLKADPLRKTISKEIRKGKQGVKVMLVCGARAEESDNRMANFTKSYNHDPAQKGNIWVNLLHHWTLDDRNAFLSNCGIPENPVAKNLCRSGECMCGTMQSDQSRKEAEYFYPKWGKWISRLEKRVIQRFPWKWGRDMPKQLKQMRNGQKAAFYEEFEERFMPMCVGCGKNDKETEPISTE